MMHKYKREINYLRKENVRITGIILIENVKDLIDAEYDNDLRLSKNGFITALKCKNFDDGYNVIDKIIKLLKSKYEISYSDGSKKIVKLCQSKPDDIDIKNNDD